MIQDSLGLSKEGIEHLLVTNRSFRAMTGIDGVRRWKGKEFFSDTAKQLCRVPCWKIGPSNGFAKKGITR